MQAGPNLLKITVSGAKYPKCIPEHVKHVPIAYLNKIFTNCNENLALGKQEPFIGPYMFWYQRRGEKVLKTSFYILLME